MNWRRRHFPFNAEQTVNILGEIGPLVAMFLVNGIYGIAAGTWALIGTTVISLVVSLLMLGRPPIMPFIAGAVSITFGTLTLITGDAMWVQIKVTLFNALVAVVLWVGLRTGHNFFRFVFGKTFHYTKRAGTSSRATWRCSSSARPSSTRWCGSASTISRSFALEPHVHRHRHLDTVQDLHHHAGHGRVLLVAGAADAEVSSAAMPRRPGGAATAGLTEPDHSTRWAGPVMSDEAQKPERPAEPNPLVKLLIDLGPLVAFFLTYAKAGIFWATGVLMVATVVALDRVPCACSGALPSRRR